MGSSQKIRNQIFSTRHKADVLEKLNRHLSQIDIHHS